MFSKLWSLLKEIHYDQRGGTGTAVATGDIITAAKMNLKLEEIVDADLVHDVGNWTVGEDGAGQDIIFYTDTAGRVMTWDPSDFSLELDDNVIIAFGDDDDVEIKWDSAKLSIIPLTDDTGYIIIGDATHSFDFKWLGSDGDHYVLFDLGDSKVVLEAIDLYLGDNDMLVFGDGVDITIKWNAAKLVVEQASVNSAIELGIDGAGIDLKLFGDTAGSYMLWDQSADKLLINIEPKAAANLAAITANAVLDAAIGYYYGIQSNIEKSGTDNIDDCTAITAYINQKAGAFTCTGRFAPLQVLLSGEGTVGVITGDVYAAWIANRGTQTNTDAILCLHDQSAAVAVDAILFDLDGVVTNIFEFTGCSGCVLEDNKVAPDKAGSLKIKTPAGATAYINYYDGTRA